MFSVISHSYKAHSHFLQQTQCPIPAHSTGLHPSSALPALQDQESGEQKEGKGRGRADRAGGAGDYFLHKPLSSGLWQNKYQERLCCNINPPVAFHGKIYTGRTEPKWLCMTKANPRGCKNPLGGERAETGFRVEAASPAHRLEPGILAHQELQKPRSVPPAWGRGALLHPPAPQQGTVQQGSASSCQLTRLSNSSGPGPSFSHSLEKHPGALAPSPLISSLGMDEMLCRECYFCYSITGSQMEKHQRISTSTPIRPHFCSDF